MRRTLTDELRKPQIHASCRIKNYYTRSTGRQHLPSRRPPPRTPSRRQLRAALQSKFRSGGGTQCAGGMDSSPAAAAVATVRPRVGGEKRGRQRSTGEKAAVVVVVVVAVASRRHVVTSRLHIDTSRRQPFLPGAVACGCRGTGASRLGYLVPTSEVGIHSGSKWEGRNRNRVQIYSGSDLTEQQIQCIPSLETIHFSPPDWALFRPKSGRTERDLRPHSFPLDWILTGIGKYKKKLWYLL
jgi:hypothetical protein